MKDVRFRAWVYDPDLEEYVMKDGDVTHFRFNV